MAVPGVAALALALALSAQAFAQSSTVYKWVDEQGVTHYSQKPPAQRPFQRLDVPGVPTEPGGQRGTSGDLQQQEAEFQQRQRQREREAASEQARRQAVLERERSLGLQCEQARARIAYLQRQRRGPAATIGESGALEWWNFEQRGRELEALGRFVDERCPRE